MKTEMFQSVTYLKYWSVVHVDVDSGNHWEGDDGAESEHPADPDSPVRVGVIPVSYGRQGGNAEAQNKLK